MRLDSGSDSNAPPPPVGEAPLDDRSVRHLPLAPSERAAALAQSPPRISRRVLLIGAAVICVLGIGGSVADSLLATPSGPPPSTTTPVSIPAQPTRRAGLASFLGLSALTPRPAPRFDLVDQRGDRVSLASLAGKVVVVSFLDVACTGICPVVAAELRVAARRLAGRSSRVAFVTVNASPYHTTVSAARRAAAASGLSSLSNWSFLTGPLPILDSLWKSYGVSVEVATNTGRTAYSQVIYLLGPGGRLRDRMTPFANQARSTGTDSLPASEVTRFGRGIATYAERLLPS